MAPLALIMTLSNLCCSNLRKLRIKGKRSKTFAICLIKSSNYIYGEVLEPHSYHAVTKTSPLSNMSGNSGTRKLSMIRVAARTSGCATAETLSGTKTASSHAECRSKIETLEERTKRIWKNADAVAFDVDSTVCQDEAIDELAKFLGVGEAVANVTRQAMNGNTRFRDALKARLEVMRPSYDQLEKYVKETKPKLTPGIRDLVDALHKRGTAVFLVSGGFRRLIFPVADILGIDRKRVYANEILFDVNKNYAGFDESELTSDSGSKDVGKPAVMGLLKKKGYRQLVMVGDGATDLEAAPPADAFIGFGGNQIRQPVKSKADWYVTDFEVLRKALE